MERALGVTVLALITGEVPDDQSLVSASGEEHVGANKQSAFVMRRRSVCRNRARSGIILLHGSGQAGDPAILCPS